MKSLLGLVGLLCFSMSVWASDCSWKEADCVADDIYEVVEGTWIEPMVEPITDELRELDDDDD